MTLKCPTKKSEAVSSTCDWKGVLTLFCTRSFEIGQQQAGSCWNCQFIIVEFPYGNLSLLNTDWEILKWICLHERKLPELEAFLRRARNQVWKQWRPCPRGQWRSYFTCLSLGPFLWRRRKNWNGKATGMSNKFVAYILALKGNSSGKELIFDFILVLILYIYILLISLP